MVHERRFNFLLTNLLKLHNIPKIWGLTTIKSLFARETDTTKNPNLFELHNRLVNDSTMH